MKRVLFTAVLLFFGICLQAQYSVRLIVTTVATKKLDDIYVAGSFNNWDPHDANYKLKPFGATRKAIVLKNIPEGKIEFKFTRGSWEKTETTAKGEDIQNRVITIGGDVSEDFTIEGWKDDYPDKPKPNTATAQVHLLDSAFVIPQLNITRRIWLYLPKSYNVTKGRSYPVLYMQDGQNLFNVQTAAFGEWNVDETLDSLQKFGKECIVVGIDNGGDKRLNEYNPFDSQKFGKGEGKQYVDFIVTTLKPFIDKNYRTLKDAKHTAIAGSSFGALISLYAEMQYPDVFGAAGIFSPSFEEVPEFYDAMQQANFNNVSRFYFYAGGAESVMMVKNLRKMVAQITAKHNYDIQEIVMPLGEHSEKWWSRAFPSFIQWWLK